MVPVQWNNSFFLKSFADPVMVPAQYQTPDTKGSQGLINLWYSPTPQVSLSAFPVVDDDNICEPTFSRQSTLYFQRKRVHWTHCFMYASSLFSLSSEPSCGDSCV